MRGSHVGEKGKNRLFIIITGGYTSTKKKKVEKAVFLFYAGAVTILYLSLAFHYTAKEPRKKSFKAEIIFIAWDKYIFGFSATLLFALLSPTSC